MESHSEEPVVPGASREASCTSATDPIVIVSAGDSGFAMPMVVALHSALSTLDRAREVLVYILADGIGAEDRAHGSAVLRDAHPGASVQWLTPDTSIFSALPGSPWHSRAMYLRLLIPHLLPDRLSRVLYLDADVVVARDLSPLWSIDMAGHPVMAVEIYSNPTLGTAIPQLLDVIEASPDTPYFNSGVLLMNLPLWREQRVSERVLAFLRAHGDRVVFADQDALNAVLAGDWGRLDPSYNIQLLTLRCYGQRRHHRRECRRQQRALLSKPAILHYTGLHKPWHWPYAGPASGAFLRAALNSGWFAPLAGQAWRTGRALTHLGFAGVACIGRAAARLRRIAERVKRGAARAVHVLPVYSRKRPSSL